jgi:general secretion pathway protein G
MGLPRARGFTVIELMVVIAIIGLLAAAAMPYYKHTLQQAKEATLLHSLRVMRDVIQQYKVDKKKYPEALQSLVDDGYLRAMPKDPITDATDTWVEVHAEPKDPDDPNADTGVVDVKSGAPGNSIDGVPFAEL